jgi:hypothetical protein
MCCRRPGRTDKISHGNARELQYSYKKLCISTTTVCAAVRLPPGTLFDKPTSASRGHFLSRLSIRQKIRQPFVGRRVILVAFVFQECQTETTRRLGATKNEVFIQKCTSPSCRRHRGLLSICFYSLLIVDRPNSPLTYYWKVWMSQAKTTCGMLSGT